MEPARELKPGKGGDEGQPVELHSLFGEILDWMLAPLLFLWPISIVATNHVANQIADLPYDRELGANIAALVRQVDTQEARIRVKLSGPLRDLLRGDEEDTTYFQVLGPRGELLAGDSEIPGIEVVPTDELSTVRYRDESIHGEETRVAYLFVPVSNGRRPVLVQVAETRHKREQLASKIISGVLLPQFAIIPLAVVLVWLGLTRGLAPLNRLQLRIRQRRPDDLSPINLRSVPEELKPMVAAFNDMMARLDDNLEAQQRFIAAAAHQLKTPLTGLKTQVELALGEPDATQLRDYLQRIANGVDRASHLTYQLLQLARAEASHEKSYELENLSLPALAHEVTVGCVPRALARGVDLGYETGAPEESEGVGGEIEVHPLISGVPVLLREMIENLVDNAIKYTPAGGHVTVRVRYGMGWVLEVEDSGIGIAPEDRGRVFERFYRVLGTDAEGSGLGLAIVREIADLHRIRIEVLAGAGDSGTLMRLYFAIAESATSASTTGQ
jgi:two-component system sensor histidine kinase TctE